MSGAITTVKPPTLVVSVATDGGRELGHQQIIAHQNGYAIAYRGANISPADSGDIFIKIYDNVGNEVGATKVNTSAGKQDEPSLASLADGRIVVTWHDWNGDSFIQQQIVDARPTPVQVIGTDGCGLLHRHCVYRRHADRRQGR